MRRRGLERALRCLDDHAVLLGHDGRHASVSSLVAGESVKGSWWSHALAHDIHWVYQELEHREDLLRCKLLSAKITFLKRRLWPALLAVGVAGEPWQRRGLSPGARALLRRVEREGGLRSDELRRSGERPGDRVRELERRLLLAIDEIHTETGAHAKQLESWDAWRRRHRLRPPRLTAPAARAAITAAARALYPDLGRTPRLPWPADL